MNHLEAVRALEKASFRILRQSKHIVMTDGVRKVTIPRHNSVNAITMAGIARTLASPSTNFANCSDAGAGSGDLCLSQVCGLQRSVAEKAADFRKEEV